MLDKLKSILKILQQAWAWCQDFISIKGGLFVDAFAVVMIVRLLGPLKGFPPLTVAEAGMWAATITAFAASNIGGSK